MGSPKGSIAGGELYVSRPKKVNKDKNLNHMIYIIAFILCAAVAYDAKKRGSNPFFWFLVSLIITPVIAYPSLLVLDWERERQKRKKVAEEKQNA